MKRAHPRAARPLLTVLAIITMLGSLLAFAAPAGAEDRATDVDGPSMRAISGPDAFGHTSTDSTEIGGPVFSFVDISPTGTGTGLLIAVGDNSSSINSGIVAPVTLGAPFPFYTVTYTTAVASTNGYISLNDPFDGGPDFSNDCGLPASPSTPGGTPAARIYPLHDDLTVGGELGSPTGGVFYEYFPVSPYPHPGGLVIGASIFQWHEAAHWPTSVYFDFEAILFDNGDIVYQYAAGNPELGSGSTQGIQNRVKVETPVGLVHGSCNTFGSLADSFAIWIQRPVFTCAGLPATITGSPFADTIFGTNGDDVIVSRGGADTIKARRGNDVICAGTGDDFVFAGPGDDRVWGQDGADYIEGNGGDDLLRGGRGDDHMAGSGGNDRVFGGGGADSLFGGSGRDFLGGGAGDDTLTGNSGSDRANGGPGADTCSAEVTVSC